MSKNLAKDKKTIVQGSILDVARSRRMKPEDVLAEADVVVMLDTSYSMGGSKTRQAEQALKDIQRTFPGRVILIEFSSIATFRWNGLPLWMYDNTMMGKAIEKALEFKGLGMKFYFISDGVPSDGDLALDWAKKLNEPITTIFIGSESDTAGQAFLRRLSAVAGGKTIDHVEVKKLAQTVTKLLTEGR